MPSGKVDNLSYSTAPDSLPRTFEKYAEIGDACIPRDYFANQPRGFAFARFHDKRHAEVAKNALDGLKLGVCELRVQMARWGRQPNPYSADRRGTPPRGYKRQSRNPRRRRESGSGRGGSRSQGRCRFSHQKPPSGLCGPSPSTSASRCACRPEPKASSVSRSSSLTKSRSRSRSRSLPPEEKSSSQPKNPAKLPEEEGMVPC